MESVGKNPSDDECTPSWLDKDFIGRALKNDDPTIDASSVELISVQTAGGGYLSETLRVVARSTGGSGAARETSLFVKAALKPTGVARDVTAFGVYDKEAIAYSHFLPSLHSALNKVEGRKFQPLAPKLYLQGSEPLVFMVLEDLSATGFRPWPQGDNLDLAASTAAIRAVARMHAASVCLLSHERYSTKVFHQSLVFNEFVLQCLDTDEATFKEDLQVLDENPWFRKYTDKLRASARVLLQTPVLRVKYCAVDFKVMLHGDLHKSNMMFRTDEDGLQVRLYDFQGLHVGSPAEDLQYFLHSSASLEVLQHHTDLLLSEYHSTLQRTLRALGLQQQADTYPLEQLRRDMDHFGTVAVITAFKILPFLLRTDDMGLPLDSQSENFKEQMEKFRRISYRNEKYLRYLECLLPVFDSKGYFESQST
ncbi:uncharacterized protein LOC126336178 [Schistocerca gregaria]|uniref:uncharacterized protein LOC126336178 n=1 Tax=Schistocerca gregaria TaxID=7010 RepID=UPI00211E6AE0|nr:uncharacterized protein LOC126336178 [Schistocerca gregaria]